MIKQRTPDKWRIPFDTRIQIPDWIDRRFLPHMMAPALRNEEGTFVLSALNFSLIPSWSKERRPKFATHNARLETVEEKPTWREPFKSRHCLIPISRFFEPIYTGEFAGNMVAFFPKDQDEVMWAAGIWDEWMDKETGEVVESYSILTKDPGRFIEKIGHDRTPVFLKPEQAMEWISMNPKEYKQFKDFLLENFKEPELNVEVDRPMRPGWQKRA